MKKKEKTWIIRGTVRKFETKFLGEFGSIIFLGMEARMVQSGNAKGISCSDWIDVSGFQGSQIVLSGMEFYRGQDIIVWVGQTIDEKGKSTYELKRVREQTRDFVSGVKFLENFI